MSDNFVTRRTFIRHIAAIGATVPIVVVGRSARSAPADARELSRERIAIVYATGPDYLRVALASLNRFLRDHYTGELTTIDSALFDQLFELRRVLGVHAPFEVISGYRSPATNAMLQQRASGVAQDSLHMQGRAIDVRLPGVALVDVRDAARSLRAGGVGFYPRSNFVHLDTGRIRSW